MIKIVLVIVCILVFIMLFWRLLSFRYTLPCPSWLSWMVEMDNPFFKINRAATIVKHLQLEKGMKVLDVGCGPGRLVIPIAKQVGKKGEVVAMDIQLDMLEKTRKKADKFKLKNITYLHASIGDGKLEHSKFDRALLVTVVGEIPNNDVAMKEIFTALKPDGILSVTEIILDPHFQSYKKVVKCAEAVGFREKNFFGGRFAFTVNLEKPKEL